MPARGPFAFRPTGRATLRAMATNGGTVDDPARCSTCHREIPFGQPAHSRLGDPRTNCDPCGPLPDDRGWLERLLERAVWALRRRRGAGSPKLRWLRAL